MWRSLKKAAATRERNIFSARSTSVTFAGKLSIVKGFSSFKPSSSLHNDRYIESRVGRATKIAGRALSSFSPGVVGGGDSPDVACQLDYFMSLQVSDKLLNHNS